MNWELAASYRNAYGIQEIAEVLGVPPNTVRQWRRRQAKDLPPPDAELASGPIWFGNDIIHRTGGMWGIEDWISERVEESFGLPIPEWEDLMDDQGEWQGGEAVKAASEAEEKAEIQGYLSPLLLAFARSAARGHALGMTERKWRSTVIGATKGDMTVKSFLRKAKAGMQDDGLWPWKDAARTPAAR